MVLEKDVERHFVWSVERIGGRTFKFRSPQQRGVADRIACMPDGSTWFVELKRPKGGRLAPLQKLHADELRRLNQKYALLWSTEEIDAWMTQNGYAA